MPASVSARSPRAHPTKGNAAAPGQPVDDSPVWKPSVTVAAVIEREGRFLLVEEQTADGIRLNQPAGHLDPGESLLAAAARETLEETAFGFTPTHLIGVYLWRSESAGGPAATYLRFAFCGELGAFDPERTLDDGILRTLWLTPAEIAARRAEHRSPLVQRCVDDYRNGARHPLELLFTHSSALAEVVAHAGAAAESAQAGLERAAAARSALAGTGTTTSTGAARSK